MFKVYSLNSINYVWSFTKKIALAEYGIIEIMIQSMNIFASFELVTEIQEMIGTLIFLNSEVCFSINNSINKSDIV